MRFRKASAFGSKRLNPLDAAATSIDDRYERSVADSVRRCLGELTIAQSGSRAADQDGEGEAPAALSQMRIGSAGARPPQRIASKSRRRADSLECRGGKSR